MEVKNKHIIFQIQEIALAEVFDENLSEEYYYRKMVRQYSKTFHTPLHEALKLPYHEVLQHLFEERFEEMKDGEDGEIEIKYIATRVIDPDYDKKQEDDLKDFVSKIADKISPKPEKPVSSKKVFDESPPVEASSADDGLDSLVDGIGSED